MGDKNIIEVHNTLLVETLLTAETAIENFVNNLGTDTTNEIYVKDSQGMVKKVDLSQKRQEIKQTLKQIVLGTLVSDDVRVFVPDKYKSYVKGENRISNIKQVAQKILELEQILGGEITTSKSQIPTMIVPFTLDTNQNEKIESLISTEAPFTYSVRVNGENEGLIIVYVDEFGVPRQLLIKKDYDTGELDFDQGVKTELKQDMIDFLVDENLLGEIKILIKQKQEEKENFLMIRDFVKYQNGIGFLLELFVDPVLVLILVF